MKEQKNSKELFFFFIRTKELKRFIDFQIYRLLDLINSYYTFEGASVLGIVIATTQTPL